MAIVIASIAFIVSVDQGWAWYARWRFNQIMLVVVDDVGLNMSGGDGPCADRVQAIARDGSARWIRTATELTDRVSARKGLAIDAPRGVIYVQEIAGPKIRAIDAFGVVAFTIWHTDTSAIDVDPKTGEVWCVQFDCMDGAQTAVYDVRGRLVRTYAGGGLDIKYSRFDDTFWRVGKSIARLSRGGGCLEIMDLPGWNSVSVAPNYGDGSAWVAQVGDGESSGRLVLVNKGAVNQDIRLHRGTPLSVVCDQKTGLAFILVSSGFIERIAADGTQLSPFRYSGRAMTLSEQTGRLWLSSANKAIALNAIGDVVNEYICEDSSVIIWLAAP